MGQVSTPDSLPAAVRIGRRFYAIRETTCGEIWLRRMRLTPLTKELRAMGFDKEEINTMLSRGK